MTFSLHPQMRGSSPAPNPRPAHVFWDARVPRESQGRMLPVRFAAEPSSCARAEAWQGFGIHVSVAGKAQESGAAATPCLSIPVCTCIAPTAVYIQQGVRRLVNSPEGVMRPPWTCPGCSCLWTEKIWKVHVDLVWVGGHVGRARAGAAPGVAFLFASEREESRHRTGLLKLHGRKFTLWFLRLPVPRQCPPPPPPTHAPTASQRPFTCRLWVDRWARWEAGVQRPFLAPHLNTFGSNYMFM